MPSLFVFPVLFIFYLLKSPVASFQKFISRTSKYSVKSSHHPPSTVLIPCGVQFILNLELVPTHFYFDENIFLWGEEILFSYNVSLFGDQIFYYSSPCVHHKSSHSTALLSHLRKFRIQRDSFSYYRPFLKWATLQ